MNKICFLLLIVPLIPYAFAHPEITDVMIITPEGLLPEHHIIGLEKEKQKVVTEPEIFTNHWFWQNFILLLVCVIVLIVGITVIVIYRSEIRPSQHNF